WLPGRNQATHDSPSDELAEGEWYQMIRAQRQYPEHRRACRACPPTPAGHDEDLVPALLQLAYHVRAYKFGAADLRWRVVVGYNQHSHANACRRMRARCAETRGNANSCAARWRA